MNYRKYLTENILPFWISNAIDQDMGGIFCSLDKNGTVTCENKNLWFTARALWSFANAYNTIEPKKEYLNACQSLYTFIKNCNLTGGRLPFLTDRNGNALEQKNLFHGEAHAAMGCAAYYRACRDENVKRDAVKFFDIAFDMYMSDRARKETAKEGTERYIFGRDMFALSVAQAMRAGKIKDERIEILAKKSIENIVSTGYINDKRKIVNEYALPGKEVGDYSCYGHLFEAAWFILYEGVVQNDSEIKNLGKKILDYSLTRNNVKMFTAIPIDSNSKGNEFYWWPQCEAIIAYYAAYNIFKDGFYLECAKNTEKFAFESFADKKGKEWFLKCDKNGNVIDSSKGSNIKGVFHLPRMLMVLAALQEKGSVDEWM